MSTDTAIPTTAGPVNTTAAAPDRTALGEQVRSTNRSYLLHSWAVQATAELLPVDRASGSWFWDYAGNKYLDFSSQLVNVNIGHQHPKLVAAIQEQAARLCTISPNMANDVRGEAAKLIAEVAPGDLNTVFFTSGGADSVETAIRMAKLYTGRQKVLAAYRSYHGSTSATATLTGEPRRWLNEPGINSVVHFWGPHPYRSQFFSETPEQECERALQHLRDTLMVEGPHTVAALILESVIGTNGILVPPDGYLQGVRDLCTEFGIVYIADEVMAGFGRCGEWFAVNHWGVVPDLITFAKGVNSGYVPLGGVLISDPIAEYFSTRPFPNGWTYSGHPLACAAAVASIGIFKEEGIVENARMIGETVLGPGLRALMDKHPSIGEVRGLGTFWAVELVTDRATRAPLVPFAAAGAAAAPMGAFTARCKELGLWPFVHMNRTHVCPPCTVSAEEATLGLEILDEALLVADGYYTGS